MRFLLYVITSPISLIGQKNITPYYTSLPILHIIFGSWGVREALVVSFVSQAPLHVGHNMIHAHKHNVKPVKDYSSI